MPTGALNVGMEWGKESPHALIITPRLTLTKEVTMSGGFFITGKGIERPAPNLKADALIQRAKVTAARETLRARCPGCKRLLPEGKSKCLYCGSVAEKVPGR